MGRGGFAKTLLIADGFLVAAFLTFQANQVIILMNLMFRLFFDGSRRTGFLTGPAIVAFFRVDDHSVASFHAGET